MSEISVAIGFNLIVISPTIALVGTALVLLFFTITIESNESVKKSITLIGILITSFCVFLKFGLFLENGVSSYFTQKILLDEFSLFGNVLISLILLFNFLPIWDSSKQLKEKTTEAIILTLMCASGFMLMADMSQLAYRPLIGNGINRDTQVMTNVQSADEDLRKDMILTEAGLEVTLSESHALYNLEGV